MTTVLVLITAASLAVAAAMTLVAWRLVRAEQRRFDSNVERLAAEIHAQEPPAELRGSSPSPVGDSASVDQRGSMFTQPTARSTALPAAAVVGAALLVAAASAGASKFLTRADAAPALPNRPAPAPVELVSLEHRQAAGAVVVRGAVREPSADRSTHLTAIVTVYGRSGELVGTGRAPVRPQDTDNGLQAFEVTVVTDIQPGRYRVSFRKDEQVVPHVDRRAHAG
jgi:hypothetical protein